MEELEEKMADPGFWSLMEEKRNEIFGEIKEIKQIYDPIHEVEKKIEDTLVLLDLAIEEDDEKTLEEVVKDTENLSKVVQGVILKTSLSGEDDHRNAFLSLQAGAGGKDACDWNGMLLRMYLRYADRKSFKTEIVDQQYEEEGGIKSATIYIKGSWAYGFLKSERGVHRLIRISPYDASGRRHTSFAAVDVVPEFDKELAIDIQEKELRIDYYRSSGAGGQHVNVTDSAVRITHLPTGIVVCCQNERSQHKNRAMAMKILYAKLYHKKKMDQEKEIHKLYGNKAQVSWSNQIRSYFLHPYTLIKDHRTDYETGNVEAILDGEIEAFVETYLTQFVSAGQEKSPGKKEPNGGT